MRTIKDATPRALLTMPHYSGTLAAARCLAEAGVPVDVVMSRRPAVAAWSRAVTGTFAGLSMDDPEQTLRWLVSFGRARPGSVLHPTCDDLAWLIARHADELDDHFRLYTAPYSAVQGVLDKRRLYRAAVAAGLEVPATWFPSEEREVEQLAVQHERLVVKPRCQVFFEKRYKGEVVQGPAHAVRAFCAHRDAPYAPGVLMDTPDMGWPMIQEYYPAAAAGVYSLTGFADRNGRIHGPRGAVKVLQRPRLGVGLCFEAAAVETELLARLERLCAETGYFGVFEAEFIPDGERRLLIDFNPRYYGQMGFDVARGVPHAWMLHLCAIGREGDIATAANEPGEPIRAYQDSISLRWLLALGRIAGGVRADEAQRWRRWLGDHQEAAVDSTIRSDDILPAVASAAATVLNTVLHPRSSLRSFRSGS